MNTKDIYLKVASFADDEDIIRMLSVNKKYRAFDDPNFFINILKTRYPLLIRFKNDDETWKQFYLRMIYYLAKLREELSLPYLPSYDYNPEIIYNYLIKDKNVDKQELINRYNTDYDSTYHTLVTSSDSGHIVNPLVRGLSISYYLLHYPVDEEILDFDSVDKNNNWLGFILFRPAGQHKKEEMHLTEFFKTEKEAKDFLYDEYTTIVNEFVDDLFENLTVPEPREQIMARDAGLTEGWNDRELFMNNTNSFDLKLDSDWPNKEFIYYHFQVEKIEYP